MVAGKPISIQFIAEVAQYLREVKRMEVTTDDLADALVATSNSSDDLERKLRKAMRGAAEDTERLERTIKDLPKATGKAADEAKKDFTRIGDEAGEAGKEAGTNLAQNLGEGLSSGDLSDTVQDALGEALGSIKGPVSAAFAAGAAIALAVWNSFRAESEKQKAMLNQVLDITDEVTGAIDTIALLRLGVEELGGGDYGQGLRDVAKYSREIGVSTEDLVAVISGELNPASQATLDLLQDEADRLSELVQKRKLTQDERERRGILREILGTVELTTEAVEQGKAAQDTWNTATADARKKAEAQAAAQGAVATQAERTAAAASQTRTSIEASYEKLKQIQAIPDKKVRVDVDVSVQGNAPGAAFIGKYVV